MNSEYVSVGDQAANWWERIAGGLWFIPSIVVLAAIAIAITLIDLSNTIADEALASFPRIFGASAESARSMLATLAGSMVTVAGVTFSIMVVAVSQASSQYTPRVLRNFMKDRWSQVTLGVFMGVFVYCLLVLRTIRTEADLTYVPELAVVGAILFSILAVAILMYFIHHIASTLEAGTILAQVAGETVHSAERLFPERVGSESSQEMHEEVSAAQHVDRISWTPVLAVVSGYIQHVDADGLARWALRNEAIVRMDRAVGEFVVQGLPLVSVSVPDTPREELHELADLFVIDTYRTVFQDVSFGIRQIVDIAVKALSPGVNDTTTAVACVDHLSTIIARLATRVIPSRYRFSEGRLVVVARRPGFQEFVEEAFDEIRRSASDNIRVLLRMVRSLEEVSTLATSAQRRQVLVDQAARIRRCLDRYPGMPEDGARAIEECERIRRNISLRAQA